VAGDIWKDQLDGLLDAYRELANAAIRLRMPHNNRGGACQDSCMRCEGERLYDALIARTYSETPPDAA
jgi:hypothetical protein